MQSVPMVTKLVRGAVVVLIVW